MTEPDNTFITEAETPQSERESNQGGMSILPHLLLVGFILFLVFSTLIIPKAISYLTVQDLPVETSVATVYAPTDSTDENFINLALRAEAVHVLDMQTGATLYEKNAEEALPLASITKLMTALLAYELAENNTPIVVSREAAQQESGGGLTWGEEFTAKDLTDFALVSSFNAAAYALASEIGSDLGEQDSTAQFVAAMNIKAEELNLPSLEFFNPTGLDISSTKAGAYGNARETSQLVAYIYQTYPEILQPTTASELTLYNTEGAYHTGENTNDSVRKIPNLRGSKTGYTDLAGGNLTIVFDAGFNRPVVVTVLGSTLRGRFTDVELIVAAVQAALAKQ